MHRIATKPMIRNFTSAGSSTDQQSCTSESGGGGGSSILLCDRAGKGVKECKNQDGKNVVVKSLCQSERSNLSPAIPYGNSNTTSLCHEYSTIRLELLDPTETDLTESTRTERTERLNEMTETENKIAIYEHNPLVSQQYPLSNLMDRLHRISTHNKKDCGTTDGGTERTTVNTRETRATTAIRMPHNVHRSVEEITQPLVDMNTAGNSANSKSYDCNISGKACSFQDKWMQSNEQTSTSVHRIQNQPVADINAQQQNEHHQNPPWDQTPLLALSDLIDRLHQVNHEADQIHSGVPELHRIIHCRSLTSTATQEKKNQLSVAEMTHILQFVNDMDTKCTPTAIYPKFHQHSASQSNKISSRNESFIWDTQSMPSCLHRQDVGCTMNPNPNVQHSSHSLDGNTHCPIGRCSMTNRTKPTTITATTTNMDRKIFRSNLPNNSESGLLMLSSSSTTTLSINDVTVSAQDPSLSPEDLFDTDYHSTMDSAFSLTASWLSCSSSVTWYEGSDIDEITIDSEDFVIEEILGTDDDDDDDDDLRVEDYESL